MHIKCNEKAVKTAIKAGACQGVIRDRKAALKLSVDRFDKLHRQVKRRYNRGKMIELDQMSDRDPKAFWEQIKKLGPQKEGIPWRIDNEDGSCIFDKAEILETWSSAFENLYQNEGDYDNEYLQHKINERENLVSTGSGDVSLDDPISYKEVKNCVLKAKNKKTVGIDGITNEVLKNENVIKLLYNLFRNLYDGGQIPQYMEKSPDPSNT